MVLWWKDVLEKYHQNQTEQLPEMEKVMMLNCV